VGAVGAVGAAGKPLDEKKPPCPVGLAGSPSGEGRRAELKETFAPARSETPSMVRAADGLCPVEVETRVRVRVRELSVALTGEWGE
jgi:hypothetical protein